MWDTEVSVDQLIRDHDDTQMPLPSIDSEPHLLISKVRKHYMEYLVKLLSANYESNQRLVNKNIYLPSAIWRCAKGIETKAAQASMVVQLYRSHLVTKIKELKKDTNKGKLNKMLYECLHWPPDNEKQLQTNSSIGVGKCSCQCTCSKRKRRRTKPSPAQQPDSQTQEIQIPKNNIPILTTHNEIDSENLNLNHDSNIQFNFNIPSSEQPFQTQIQSNLVTNKPMMTMTSVTSNCDESVVSDKSPKLADSQTQDSDELMMQLEKLFHADPTDDDLFDEAFGDTNEWNASEVKVGSCDSSNNKSSVIETHAAQIKSLDERLASLAGLLVNSTDTHPKPAESDSQVSQSQHTERPKKLSSSKWHCEEYHLKTQLFELLDKVGDCNRKKLDRIKEMLLELFGADSDDEGVVSPLEETPEFILSCKERLAPWVVKVLTPYYIKGRIKGKALFKLVAKHLIRLIYQCSRYPHERDVYSFVTDFLSSHKTIRCEADFKEFKIVNL